MSQLKLLTNPSFIRLLIGSTASGLSTWGLVFLLGLLVPTGMLSAVQLGLILGIRTVGFLVGVVFGGIFADRLSRRVVILWSSLIAAAAIVLLVVGINAHIGWAYFGAVFAGLGQGGCRPAYQALVPQLIPAKDLQSANAWIGLAVRLVNLMGPALTSAIVLFWGVNPAFVLLLSMWLVSAFTPPWVEEPRNNSPRQTTMLRSVFVDCVEGLREARKYPWFIATLCAFTLVIAFGYSVTNVLLPLISNEQGGVALMTQCVTSYTLGGIAGALLLSRFSPSSIGWVALIGMASYGFAPFSLLYANTVVIALLGYFIAGLGSEVMNVLWFTSVQREVPDTHLARFYSLDFMCSYGLAPLGMGLIAPVASQIGNHNTLLLAGIICISAPLMVMFGVRSSKHFSITKVSSQV